MHIAIFLLLATINSMSFGASNPRDEKSNSSVNLSSANSVMPQQKIDEEFKKITTQAYRELATLTANKLQQTDLHTLITEIAKASQAKDPERANSLVLTNLPTLQKNVNEKELQDLTALVLKQSSIGVAEQIVDLVKSQGDVYAQAKQHFEFAKYEAELSHWDSALTWLRKIDIANELSKDNGDEAYIIYGAALQFKKKHREAITYYAHIKQDSAFYSIAQLNTALAYIRQDWWTDAQLTIEQALGAVRKEDIEIANRLYTILGFSQLQQGFYRNARESFRNVKIKSIYANRALLGVGMAALNQEDFIGAINAFGQLKTHSENDMSVAQSYLLNAYSLTKVNQTAEASASYTEAINYYDKKTNFYENLLSDIKNSTPATQPQLISRINQAIEKQEPELTLLEAQLITLSKLNSDSLSTNTRLQIDKLYSSIFLVYLSKAADVMTKNQIAFNSYLNQSRFGLTKLYDANN